MALHRFLTPLTGQPRLDRASSTPSPNLTSTADERFWKNSLNTRTSILSHLIAGYLATPSVYTCYLATPSVYTCYLATPSVYTCYLATPSVYMCYLATPSVYTLPTCCSVPTAELSCGGAHITSPHYIPFLEVGQLVTLPSNPS